MKFCDGETLKIKIRRRKTAGKIVFACLWVLLVFAAVCVGISLFQKVIAKRKDANIFGFSSFGVVSGSMQPSINVYDIIVVKKVAESKLFEGDVIAFFDGDGNVITHRIAEISERDGNKLYVTKGDANGANDREAISYGNIIGRLSFRIPGGMRIVAALTSPWGITLIILLFAFVGFVIIRKSNRKAARHSIREKYKEQSVGEENNINK